MPKKEERVSSLSVSEKDAAYAKAKLAESEIVTVLERSPARPPEHASSSRPFLVGIGSSAGGLESMQGFFKNMPVESGVAIVIVTHLAEHRKSLLPEIIQLATSMPTKQIENHTAIEPNSIYLNPPGFDVEIVANRFVLKPTEKNRLVNLPVDSFFFSMAQHCGSRAIGIILSGSGSDGAHGCLAIEAMGGMVMVQDPNDAGYDGMPKSALAQVNHGLVLSVEEMPRAILRHRDESSLGNTQLAGDEQAIATHSLLPNLFELLRTKTGNDFSQYKSNTLSRRIRRRMTSLQFESFEEYVKFVGKSETEAVSLHNGILIGVTKFFRDPEAFDVLESEVIPALVARKESGDSIRIWVVGCSTGQEVYSIAMLVHEIVSKQGRDLDIQIFATDIDAASIETARKGTYPQSIQKQISSSRLKRYFEQKNDGTFQVRRVVRDLVVFARQNILSDPPFTRLDLLCCRNLLIYFNSVLKARLLPLFHYILNTDGILFLGSSETAGNHEQLLVTVNNKWKIYQKRSTETYPRINFPTNLKTLDKKPDMMSSSSDSPDPFQFVEAILVEGSAPTCVVIDTNWDILYVHGRTGRFLEPSPGKISTSLISMAREGLKLELSTMIRKAFNSGTSATRNDIVLSEQGTRSLVSITVKLIKGIAGKSPELMIVIFEDPTEEESSLKLEALNKLSSDKSRTELQLELQESKDHMQAAIEELQSAIEELQSANEELKSTNEELQSTVEELQSTNEELATSKEELQSVNEESATINQELESRNQELSDSSDVLKNLLDSTEVACLFLDGEFRVRTFTPRAVDLIPLEKSDHGRLISNFSNRIKDEIDLCKFASDILDRLETKEKHIKTISGESYALKGRPYRTLANVIDGVVLTFEKITETSES